MWIERIGQIIRTHDGPLLIEENLYGVSEIAESLISPDGRVLWIEFADSKLEDLRAAAWGVPDAVYTEHLVDALRKHREIVHPSVQPIAILTRAENALDEVSRVLADGSTGHHVVVSAASESVERLAAAHPECKVLTAADLRVNSLEARTIINARHAAHDWTDFLDSDVIVSYEEFTRAAFSRLGLQMPVRPVPRNVKGVSACLTRTDDGLVALLSRNRQWKRALDVALATNSPELLRVIDLVGEDALLHDGVDSFRRQMMLLPASLRNSAEALYWRVVADFVLGLESDAQALSLQYLKTGDCPRLRMLLITVGVSDDHWVPEATQVEATDPLLTVYRAHLRSFDGSNDDSVHLLRGIMEVFRAAGRDYRLVQSMTILANSLILKGRFQEAAYWGLEAHNLSAELNLREYERSYIAGPVSYALIVSGEWESAVEILSKVHNAEKYAGRPFAEGIISTIADCFAVAGHFETALKWYEFVVHNYRGPASNIVMPDVCIMLVRLGRSSEALRLVKARIAENDLDEISRRVLELAHGLALLGSNPTQAAAILESVLGTYQVAAPYRARAALMLALEAHRNGSTQSALEVLDSIGPTLLEVGESGWQLLSGRDPFIMSLRNKWLNSSSRLNVDFMVGAGNWSFRGSNSRSVRSNRLKELIFVLSWFPDGIRGEYLRELLGWGELAQHTVRRHMHRLRKHIPVDGRPYRLGVKVTADYLELMRAIEHEDVSLALRLYAGPLLKESDAPFVREKRAEIERQLRTLVLKMGRPEEVAELALKLHDDVELLECALAASETTSPYRRRLEAQITSLQLAWADS